MEIERGILVPVVTGSEAFDNSILPPLQKSYIYEESLQSFRYKSAFLIKNATLQKRYEAFRTMRSNIGYSEEELEESYGFLLFDDRNMANSLAETGVITGHSTCSTLGDPFKGVYISKYSDCLDLNRWYQGKSGYIAIIRLTKGRIKKVAENYTQNFTSPSVGFDCHASEQLSAVSSNTSSFLAFERTQYYMYELLDGGNTTATSPSHACPFAIVSFSYGDTKARILEPQEKSEEGRAAFNYYPWKGQLQIKSKIYHVGLKSNTGALIPAKLPKVMEVGRAIAMAELKQLLPKAVFETCFTGEVSLDGMCCYLYQLVPSEANDSALSLLTQELKEKDLALAVQLNDCGFLILLHSSQFLTYEDAGSNTPEVLQGMFVFPDSRAIQRETKACQKKSCFSPDVLMVLPALSYAETEAEKGLLDQSGELCGLIEQHIQSYAALIHPGLEVSPSREASIFPDQYDVPDALKYLYSLPMWTDKAWLRLQSYLNQPAPFQLSVSRATELLATGREQRGDEPDDDVYYCLSSPEGEPRTPASSGTEGHAAVEFLTDTGAKDKRKDMHPVQVSENSTLSELVVLAKDLRESVTTVCLTAGCLSLPTTDISTELVVSVASAQRTDTILPEDDKCGTLNAATATQNSGGLDLQVFPQARLQVEGNSSSSKESAKKGHLSEAPEVTPVIKIDWRKLPRRRRRGKLGFQSEAVRAEDNENKRVLRSAAQTVLNKEPEKVKKMVPSHPLKRKTERWDLKAITTKCGRIFVPHGSEGTDKDIQSDAVPAPQHMEKGDGPSSATELKKRKRSITETMGEEPNPQKMECGVGNSEKTMLKEVDDNTNLLIRNLDTKDNSQHEVNMTQANSMGSSVSEPTISLSKEKGTKKREFVALSFSKLKKVLSRGGKMKPSPPVVQDQSSPLVTTEPLLKKRKTDIGTESLENANMCKVDTNSHTVGTLGATKTFPLDPDLARALGLAPKGLRDDTRETSISNTPLRKDSPKKVDQTTPEVTSHKTSQPLPSTLSTTYTMGRMRPLQKRGVSTEMIKKNWWLHFHTPASFASERLAKTKLQKSPQLQQVCRSHSVRKGHSQQERASSADPPTDALSLLADLALGGSKDKVLSQPDPLLDSKIAPSLDMLAVAYSPSPPKPQSVLHDILRLPAAKLSPPSEPLPPEGVEESQEGVVLISIEHSYSLPPSSSLPLGLSGAHLQGSPLPKSEGLQQHLKDIYGDGTQALHAFLFQDKPGEEPRKFPENLSKGLLRRKKFQRSRKFAEKDGSIQVTRRWKEIYDFGLDSKFTNDPKDKTVNRALHGDWDFNIKDTNEQIQLIIHMWIGLFYSRSTARFFHIDLSHEYSGDKNCAAMIFATVPGDVSSKIKTSSSELGVPCTMSDSEVLDLSKDAKKETPRLNLELDVLDLSVKNAKVVDLTVDTKDSREGIPMPHKDSEATKSGTDMLGGQEDKTNLEERSKSPLQKEAILRNTDLRSSESDGSHIILCDTTANMCIHDEKRPEANGLEKVLKGKDMFNSQEVEKSCDEKQYLSKVELVQQPERHSLCKTKACTDVEESGEGKDVAQTMMVDENESRDQEHIEETQKQDHEENYFAEAGLPAIDFGTGTTKEEIEPVNGNYFNSKLKPDVHVGKDSIDKVVIVHEENVPSDYQQIKNRMASKDEFDIEMQDETVSIDALPMVTNASDRKEQIPTEFDEKIISSEKKPIAQGDGTVSMPEVQLELQLKSSFAGQRVADSRDLQVLRNGSSSIKEYSAVEHGNGSLYDAQPVEHSEDVRVAEAPSEMLDGATFTDKVLSDFKTAAVCGGNNLSVSDSTPEGNLNWLCGETIGQVSKYALNSTESSNCGDQENRSVEGESKFDARTAQSHHGHEHSEDEASDAVHGQIEIPLLGVGNSIEDVTDNVGEVDSSEDITQSNVSHPQRETSNTVQDQTLTPQLEAVSITDVTDTQVRIDSNIAKSEIGFESNLKASKPEVAEDSCMDITHSDVLYVQDEPSALIQDPIKIPVTIEITEDISETKVSQSSNKADKRVRHEIEIPLIGKGFSNEYTPRVNQREMTCNTNLNAGNQQINAKESEFDERCQTPTVDEMPYHDICVPGNSSVSVAYRGDLPNTILRRSSTPTQDELPMDHTPSKDGHTLNAILLTNSKGSNSCNLHSGLAPKKEQVYELCSISPCPLEKDLQEPRDSHSKPIDLEATVSDLSLEQTPDPSIELLSTDPPLNSQPMHSEEDKLNEAHTSTERNYTNLSLDSLSRLYDSSFQSKLTTEEELSIPLNLDRPQLNLADQKRFPECHSCNTTTLGVSLERDDSASTEGTTKSTSHYPLTHNPNEPRGYSQRPVMAVKPSKSEESRGENICIEKVDYRVTPDVFNADPALPNTTVLSNTTLFAIDMRKTQSESFTGFSDETEEIDRDLGDIVSTQEAQWQPKDQHFVRKCNLSKTKPEGIDFYQYQEWDTQEYNKGLHSSAASTSSSTNFVETEEAPSQSQKDWYQYCHTKGNKKTVKSWNDENDEDLNIGKSSLVTVLGHNGNRITCDNPIVITSLNMHTRTIINSNIKGSNCSMEEFSERWTTPDLTQSSMDKECLIFSEKMNQMLKAKRKRKSLEKGASYTSLRHHRSIEECSSGGSPVTVCFSNLKEEDSTEEQWEALPSLAGQRIKVVMPERCGITETTDGDTALHLQTLSCAQANEAKNNKVTDMAAECTRLYSAMMDDVCAGKKLPSKPEKLIREQNPSTTRTSNHSDFCGQMKRQMYDNLHDKLKSVVRQSCGIKFRFFMLVTSTDTLFKETKELLEAEGHREVGPLQLFLDDSPSSPLLIILRNEDIAEHICEVPYLLDLKKSPGVLFAGIDRPDDIVNLTHQELFSGGGFVVFEGAALDVLSLCNMKRTVHFLEEMSKKGKWKWMLHYRDSRLLREHARSSAEARERKLFMDFCQGTGMVEVLPYHECDVISKERPNYLNCLVRLQVQNISARFPVFITDTTADNAFAKNGILTMNINSFLLISQSDSCTIS